MSQNFTNMFIAKRDILGISITLSLVFIISLIPSAPLYSIPCC